MSLIHLLTGSGMLSPTYIMFIHFIFFFSMTFSMSYGLLVYFTAFGRMVSPSYVLFIHFTVSGGSKCQKTTSMSSTVAHACAPRTRRAMSRAAAEEESVTCVTVRKTLISHVYFLSNHKAKRLSIVDCWGRGSRYLKERSWKATFPVLVPV